MNDKNKLEMLVEAATRYPSADNSQPLIFKIVENTIDIGVHCGRCNSKSYFGPGSHAVQFSLGAASESLLEVAKIIDTPAVLSKSLNGVCIDFPEISRVNVRPSDIQTVIERHTNRGAYSTKSLPSYLVQELESFKQDDVQLKLFSLDQAAPIIDLVQEASKLRFQSQDLMEFLSQSLRLSSADIQRGDGLDINTLCLPPGGKTILNLTTNWPLLNAFNKCGFYKLLALFEGLMLKKSGALLVIYSDDLQADSLSAGRLAQRAWVRLNAEGIAVHPYYVITDQLLRLQIGRVGQELEYDMKNLANKSTSFFGHEGVHMVFRVGYPTKDVIRSGRLPLDEQIMDVKKG